MEFIYGRQDLADMKTAQNPVFLLTNGLGGYASTTAAFSVTRCDQGLLNAAYKAPNMRMTMVHRLQETLVLEDKAIVLSTQEFANRQNPEEGYRYLSSFLWEYDASWMYHAMGITVTRQCSMAWEKNDTAMLYTVENHSQMPCTLWIRPSFKFAPKEISRQEKGSFALKGNRIWHEKDSLFIHTDGALKTIPAFWEELFYREDAKDGRPATGFAGGCCAIQMIVQPGETKKMEVVFSLDEKADKADEIVSKRRRRLKKLEKSCGLQDPLARQLAVAADDYIVQRESTAGKTIIAGYPLFSDWGRDTMIALGGCCLAAKRFNDAKSILETFLAYERNGLVPNLFPEGKAAPMYNTVDAALLLIDSVWNYLKKTNDWVFVKKAYPVLKRIVNAYQNGTDHGICADQDGLIRAGSDLDQLTWMDVCVNGILPTPRHGKPVEINAYWYNALRILQHISEKMGDDGTRYRAMADKVQKSFCEKFYMQDKGWLRDVLSGTKADEQLRCNQIWAVSLPFTMLSAEQEKRVVDTVCRSLYTPCGLRTLSPEDPEFQPFYGGRQLDRDLAYHQGTVWVYPMGAYYLAWLKTHGSTAEAARTVKKQLKLLEPMLREGCVGQLPEIYDGAFPAEGKGCFAQAWSVGEILRVYEEIERIEKDGGMGDACVG